MRCFTATPVELPIVMKVPLLVTELKTLQKKCCKADKERVWSWCKVMFIISINLGSLTLS